MNHRLSKRGLWILPMLLVALLLAGCPKRPATPVASPPAPGASSVASTGADPSRAGSAVPGGAVALPGTATPPAGTVAGGPGAGAGRPNPGPPPSPKEFVAIGALRDIRFDFDKYDIRAGDGKILDENARWMKANPTYLILIEGHADERGTNEYNLALGERRAKSTLNYLAAQGVQAQRMTLISYGEERPLCGEKNETCWARNRRGHFLAKAR